MKKLLSILFLSSILSCKKEEPIFEVKFITRSDTRTFTNTITITPIIYCRINGKEVDIFNPLLAAPVYTCKSGDVLEFSDTGYDYIRTTHHEYHEGYVESYIVVNGEDVRRYRGNGDAKLLYIIP